MALTEIGKKIKQMEGLEGYKICREIAHINYVHAIFNKNYSDFKESADPINKNLSLWNADRKKEFDKLVFESNRKLHNFLASAFSFYTITQEFKKNVKKDLKYKLSKITEKISEELIIKFILDLRNYSQHKKLPLGRPNISFNLKDGIKNRLTLKKDTLLEWSNWKSESKQYLINLDKNIDIVKEIDKYCHLIIKFYERFYELVGDSYKSEVEEYTKLHSEIFYSS